MEPDRLRSLSRSRSSSPARRVEVLPGIAEVRPGPNAFAQQAQRLQRHRFEGNAFYQQEFQRLRAAPPTTIHPAFRNQEARTEFDTHEPCGTVIATPSPFHDASKQHSPPLKLVPSEESYPTMRSAIEEGRERTVHEASGAAEGRTPVYQTIVPTPKPPSSGFVGVAKPPTPRKPRLSLPKKDSHTSSHEPAIKSPTKRTFFDKFRTNKASTTHSPSMNTSAIKNSTQQMASMPVKAQAVLGASQSTTHLARTPSKQKKGIFAGRKVEEQSKVDAGAALSAVRPYSVRSEDWPPSGSTQGYTKTPKTGVSDPTHYSFDAMKRAMHPLFPDQESQQNQGGLQRTQSLKYFDSVAPPTPPAKNTPPDRKVYNTTDASPSYGPVLRQTSISPSKGPESVSNSIERLNPTMFGSYGLKETPTLVTRPSVYSLHASVVPEVMEANDFEHMKSRINGLGLEGFNMPAETHHRAPEMTYSPSIYSVNWNGTPNIVSTARHGNRLSLDALCSVIEVQKNGASKNHHQASSSSSTHRSKQTIGVYYPELASDPSFQNLTSEANLSTRADHDLLVDEQIYMQDAHVDAFFQDQLHSRSRNNSSRPIATNPFTRSYDETLNASPESFRHKSAMPSPLHYLPATVYTPPPKAVHKKAEDGTAGTADVSKAANALKRSASIPPSHQNRLFDNAPILHARRPPDRVQVVPSTGNEDTPEQPDLDPLKPGAADIFGPDKQDQIVQLLNSLLLSHNTNDHYIEGLLKNVIARNTDIASMREEVRENNARFGARLAAMETLQKVQQHSSLSPLPSPDFQPERDEMDGDKESETLLQIRPTQSEMRVPTITAHEFYMHHAKQASPPISEDERVVSSSSAQLKHNRTGQMHNPTISLPPTSAGEDAIGSTSSICVEAEKLARLEETMQAFAAEIEEMKKKQHKVEKLAKLEETIGIFAAEIQEMKRKMGGRGGGGE